VEIEGLGTFRAAQEVMSSLRKPSRRCLSPTPPRSPARTALVRCAAQQGCSPGSTRKSCSPAELPRAIERAIEVSDVFVACFSRPPSPSAACSNRSCVMRWMRAQAALRRRVPDARATEECAVLAASPSSAVCGFFPDWEKGLRRLRRRSAKRRDGDLCGLGIVEMMKRRVAHSQNARRPPLSRYSS